MFFIAFGAFLKSGIKNIHKTEYLTSNAGMLESENNAPITVLPEVGYFPEPKGYFAKPEKEGKYPGVVMIHENRGLRPEIKATAMPTTTDKLAPIKWPVLGIFGSNDLVISVEKVEEFENSLNKQKITNQIYIYPGVGHAFDNPSGMNYAPNETRDAREKTLAFLDSHLQ